MRLLKPLLDYGMHMMISPFCFPVEGYAVNHHALLTSKRSGNVDSVQGYSSHLGSVMFCPLCVTIFLL